MPKLKHKVHITTVQFYEYYSKSYFKEIVNGKKKIHTQSKYYLTKTQYTNILGTINKKLMDRIIHEPLDCTLTAGLGTICIRKHKPACFIDDEGNFINKQPVNWQLTRALWREDPEAKAAVKFIRFTNLHSNQWVGRFKWLKSKYQLVNKMAYKFKPCRTATIELSKVFKNEDSEVDYFTNSGYIKPIK